MSGILVENLGKHYGDTVVLERVNVDIESGSFVAVVGASGCGKSTFLRILLGQEQATRGRVTVDGLPIAGEPTPDRGIVFQRYSVFPHLTALQNLMLAADFRHGGPLARAFGGPRRMARKEAMTLLERVGLADAAHLYPAALSGGMQQRLAIAQTLLGRPKILLLDEPFGALDPGIRAEMHELVSEIRAADPITVVMVTHDIAEAFKLGTRVLVFAKVRRDPQFPDAYGASIALDRPIQPASPTHADDVAAVAALLGVPRFDTTRT
jgi:NitT/TauT family transport system ATP-binding protein